MTENAMTDGMVLGRAAAILAGISDGALLVLKSHLLIEETLYQLVRGKLIYPAYLSKANIRFYQLLNMARALYTVTADDEQRSAIF